MVASGPFWLSVQVATTATALIIATWGTHSLLPGTPPFPGQGTTGGTAGSAAGTAADGPWLPPAPDAGPEIVAG